MSEIDDADATGAYAGKVGTRLRAIRRQKRLSLQDVEASSDQEFKASVLGAYERGERAISVPRLQRLARFYRVPVDQLLPGDDGPDFGPRPGDGDVVIDLTAAAVVARAEERSVKIDLTAMERLEGTDAEMLTRYLRMIQVQRGDFNGRVLTVRRDDLRAIACILDVTPDLAVDRLEGLGVMYAGVPASSTAHLNPRRSRHHGAVTDRSVRRLPPRAVLRGALRLLRVRHVDRSPPPHRRLPRRVPGRRRPARRRPGCRRRRRSSSGGGTPVDGPGRRPGRGARPHPARRRTPRSPSSATPTTSPASSLDTYRAGGREPAVVRRAVDLRPRARGARAAPTTAPTSSARVELARAAGFDTFNLDVIYGGAGESLDDWCRTARRRRRPRPAARLGLRPHRRGRHAARRSTPPATPTTTTRPTSTSPPPSGSAPPGYDWYEISNWSRPGHECRHNLLYWTMGEYQGLGCAVPLPPRRPPVLEPAHARALHRRGHRAAPRSRPPTSASTTTPAPSRRCSSRCAPATACPPAPLDADELPGLVAPHPDDPDRLVLTVDGRLLANEVALRLHV